MALVAHTAKMMSDETGIVVTMGEITGAARAPGVQM
jgi:hypothetical protein